MLRIQRRKPRISACKSYQIQVVVSLCLLFGTFAICSLSRFLAL